MALLADGQQGKLRDGPRQEKVHDGVAIETGNGCLPLGDAIDRLGASIKSGDDAFFDHFGQQAGNIVGKIEIKVR